MFVDYQYDALLSDLRQSSHHLDGDGTEQVGMQYLCVRVSNQKAGLLFRGTVLSSHNDVLNR
jgi:hypothetical protein